MGSGKEAGGGGWGRRGVCWTGAPKRGGGHTRAGSGGGGRPENGQGVKKIVGTNEMLEAANRFHLQYGLEEIKR